MKRAVREVLVAAALLGACAESGNSLDQRVAQTLRVQARHRGLGLRLRVHDGARVDAGAAGKGAGVSTPIRWRSTAPDGTPFDWARKPAADYDVLADLRVGRLTNWVLETVLAVERGLIRLGIRFPAGGSLLLVAQRN